MMPDGWTFFLAFTALFGGLAAYLVVLDRRARALEERLRRLEGATGPPGPGRDQGRRP